MAIVGLTIGPLSFAGEVNLSPVNWPDGVYDRYMAAQNVTRTEAGAPISYFGIMSLVYYDVETETRARSPSRAWLA